MFLQGISVPLIEVRLNALKWDISCVCGDQSPRRGFRGRGGPSIFASNHVFPTLPIFPIFPIACLGEIPHYHLDRKRKYRIIAWKENENTALSLGQKTKIPHYHLDRIWYHLHQILLFCQNRCGCAFIWSKSWNEWSSQRKTLTKLSQGQAFSIS